MEVQLLKEELERRLPQKRYEHVLRVAATAKTLARHYDVDEIRVELAALFHDIAKFMEPAEMRTLIEKHSEDVRLLTFHHELWHAAAGRIIAEKTFNVTDEDVLNAIRYHTTGRAGMSPIEKIVYVADLIEPGRAFPGIEQLRTLEGKSLDRVMRDCVSHSIKYLLDNHVAVFPDSLECYNEHVQKTQLRKES